MNTPNKKPLGRPVLQHDSMPTHKQIMFTASQLFMEKGYDAVSMNEVAEHCGVTKATIYYYYPTKNDLFVSCMVETLVQVKTRIQDILDQSGAFKDRLTLITEKYLRIPQVHVNGMFEKVKHHLSLDHQQQLIQSEHALYETLQAGFDQAVVNNEIHCEDTKIASYIYVAMLRAGQLQYDVNQALFATEREAAESIVSFLWRGIQP
ncbi:Fatty acid metabolism regulator protein [compost metagenome]